MPCLETTDKLRCMSSRYELRDLWSAASILCDDASAVKRQYEAAQQALQDMKAQHVGPNGRLATSTALERAQAIRQKQKLLKDRAHQEQHYEKKILCGAEPDWSMKDHRERLVFFSRTGAGACAVCCSVAHETAVSC